MIMTSTSDYKFDVCTLQEIQLVHVNLNFLNVLRIQIAFAFAFTFMLARCCIWHEKVSYLSSSCMLSMYTPCIYGTAQSTLNTWNVMIYLLNYRVHTLQCLRELQHYRDQSYIHLIYVLKLAFCLCFCPQGRNYLN